MDREVENSHERRPLRHTHWQTFLHFVLLYVLLAGFTFMQLTYRREVPRVPYLTGYDDFCYYAYARSLLFDRDIDFRNDFEFAVRLFGSYLAGPAFSEQLARAGTGAPLNFYNIGTGLLALPWLGVFWGVAQFLVALGVMAHPPSPFGPWYVFAYLCANLFYGLLGCWLSSGVLRRFFSAPVAAGAVFSVVFAGPALHYFLYQPGMSHLTSLGLMGALLELTVRWAHAETAGRRLRLARLWGVVFGLALAVRTINAPAGALLVVPLFRTVPCARSWIVRAGELFTVAAATLIGFFPQLLAWKVQCGQWFANPYSYEFRFWSPHVLAVLFGRRHGLFFWHPWLLVCVFGLLMAGRHLRPLATAIVAAVFGLAWLYGSWRIYWLGAAFGMRGFVEFLPFFALGAAPCLTWLNARLGSGKAVAGIILCFCLLNVHLLLCFRGGVITVDGPLKWSETLQGGRAYFSQIEREWRTLTSWQPGYSPGDRASLFENPE